MCSHNKDVATWGCNCSIPFFLQLLCFTPHNWNASGSWSPSWPCVFSFFGRCKVQSHMAVSVLCWGWGNNPLALTLPVLVARSHLFVQFSMYAVWLPLGAAALIRGSPVPMTFPSQHWASMFCFVRPVWVLLPLHYLSLASWLYRLTCSQRAHFT